MKEKFSFFSFILKRIMISSKYIWEENWRWLKLFLCLAFISFGLMAVVSVFSSSIRRNLLLFAARDFVINGLVLVSIIVYIGLAYFT